MAKRFVDLYIVYQFIRRLSTPFTKTDAYKMDLIDRDGNLLKKRKEMSKKEKKAVTHFDIMIFNLKRMLSKLPGGDSSIRNFATALWLLKEDVEHNLATAEDVAYLAEEIAEPKEKKTVKEFLSEDEGGIANSIGSGAMDNTVVPVDNFGKCRVYKVSSDTFHKCHRSKGRYERFKKYIGEGPICDDIKEFAKKNPGRSIMLQDEKTGAFHVLKLGTKERW